MPFFAGAEAKLYFEVHGQGNRPFLLLHGTTGRSTSFNPFIPHLPAGTTAFIPDLRGHGQSGHIPGGYRVIDFARDLVPFVNQEISQRAVLLGHSLGGLVALALAARHPELVAGLVIEDAPLWLRRTSVKAGSDRAYHFFKHLYKLRRETREPAILQARITAELPDVAARESPDLGSRLALVDPDVLRMSFDSSLMEGFDIDASLRAVQCPTLLLQADVMAGGSLADQDAQAAIEYLANGELVFIAGSGHQLHQERPEQLAQHIRKWLTANKL